MTHDTEHGPRVVFALPGEWASVRPHSEPAVEQFIALAPADLQRSREWFAQQAAVGTVLIMFRIRPAKPMVLTATWPANEQSGPTNLSALVERLGGGDPLTHTADYAAARARTSDSHAGTDTLAYALAHPLTGRMLVVRITKAENSFSDRQVEDFDLAVGELTWEEV